MDRMSGDVRGNGIYNLVIPIDKGVSFSKDALGYFSGVYAVGHFQF